MALEDTKLSEIHPTHFWVPSHFINCSQIMLSPRQKSSVQVHWLDDNVLYV